MNAFAPTRPATTLPGTRLSVTLTAAQWRVIERQLEKGKYQHVNRILEDLRAQLALANMRSVQIPIPQSAYNAYNNNWPNQG